jgi:hypothetical protein
MFKRSPILLILLAALLILALAACEYAPELVEREAMVDYDDAGSGYAQNSYDESFAPAPFQAQERLIIRDAELAIVVADTQESIDAIEALTDEAGGWVVSSNIWQYNTLNRGSVTVRVPAEELDAFLDAVHALAIEVTSQSVSGQDVTEEYVDLEAQLRNLQATADRVRNFLDEAKNVEEALAVNAELSQLEGEIERINGRMQYLERSSRYSSVSIDITPDELAQPVTIGRWEPAGTAKDAIEALVAALQWLIDALIVIFLLVLPLLLVIVGPIYLLIRFVRRRRAKRRQQEAVDTPTEE